VYGHGLEGNPRANIFHYQTRKANEVFAMLDGKQRERALIETAPRENAVDIRPGSSAFPGIAVRDLSSDQQALVEEVIKIVLAPYRHSDVAEAMQCFKQGGGMDKLHMAFYRNEANGSSGDLSSDGVWDLWRLESPSLVVHFRGAPHVHAYINVSSHPTSQS
jgi:hypothetical protein